MSLTIIPIEQHPATRDSARLMTPPENPDAIYATPEGFVPVAYGGLTVSGYCRTMQSAAATIHEIRAACAKEVH